MFLYISLSISLFLRSFRWQVATLSIYKSSHTIEMFTKLHIFCHWLQIEDKDAHDLVIRLVEKLLKKLFFIRGYIFPKTL